MSAQQVMESHLRDVSPSLVQRYGWKIVIEGIDVYAHMKSNIDGEEYTLRIHCEGYPNQNPQVGFVNPQTKASEPTACPLISSGEGIPNIAPGNICVRPQSGTWTVGEIIHRFQCYLNSEIYGGRRRQ